MDANSTPTFGQVVYARRRELRLSQRSLAGAIGVSQEWVSKIENGVIRAPRADTIMRIATTLRLEPTELLVALEREAKREPIAGRDREEAEGERLRGKVAEWLRIKARGDPGRNRRHAMLLTDLALDAERSALLGRLLAGDEPPANPPPRDDAPASEAP